jgi:hypothetical protein
LLVILVFAMPVDDRVALFLWISLMPVTCGVLAMVFLHLFSDRPVWSGDKLKTPLLFLIVISLSILLGIVGDLTMPLLIAVGAASLAFVWQMWNRIEKHLLVWAIQMMLLGVSVWYADAHSPLVQTPYWLSLIVQLTIHFLIPAMGITVAARLVHLSQTLDLSKDWPRIVVIFLLVLSVFSLIGYQIYLASVWGVATDGLGGVFHLMLTSIVTIAVAMIMAWFLPGKRKLVALAFALIVPLSMQYPDRIGRSIPDGDWGKSPAYITERRADTITRAIEGYYKDHGEYPQSLKDLFPWNLVYVPRPIMIPGETWCYEGGQDFYRLGYVYRQFFSTPTSVRIHASAGTPPNSYWPCEDQAAKYAAP